MTVTHILLTVAFTLKSCDKCHNCDIIGSCEMVSLRKTMAINCWDAQKSIVKVDLREMYLREPEEDFSLISGRYFVNKFFTRTRRAV